MRARSRSGTALAVVMGIILVLGVFGAIVRLLAHGASVETDLVRNHLRAVAIGEVAFSSVVARLAAAPWSKRWFAAGADLCRDVPAGGGSYSFMIRDTPGVASAPDPITGTAVKPNRADLLVRAEYGKSSVVMFWRLTVPEDSVESLATVVPTFFQFGPESTAVTPAAGDALAALVDQSTSTRDNNVPGFEEIAPGLQQAAGPAQVGQQLGFDPGVPVLQGVPPIGRQGGNPDQEKVDLANANPAVTAAQPSFPPPPEKGFEGKWYGEVVPTDVDGKGTIKRCRDVITITRSGSQWTLSTDYTDEQGVVWSHWTARAPVNGATLDFTVTAENLSTRILSNSKPTAPLQSTFKLDESGDVATGKTKGPWYESNERIWTRDA